MNTENFPARLLPFERLILGRVGDALPSKLREPYAEQIQRINKVQRLLDWREVEFYRMHWFRVNWPQSVLFDNREEFVLGNGLLSAGALAAAVTVWSADGHLFSLEADSPLQAFRGLRMEELSFQLGHNPDA